MHLPIISFFRVHDCKLVASTEQLGLLELNFNKDEQAWYLTYQPKVLAEPVIVKVPILGRHLEGCPRSYDDPDLDEIARALDEWGVGYSLIEIEC